MAARAIHAGMGALLHICEQYLSFHEEICCSIIEQDCTLSLFLAHFLELAEVIALKRNKLPPQR
jgi:hypothetical protein